MPDIVARLLAPLRRFGGPHPVRPIAAFALALLWFVGGTVRAVTTVGKIAISDAFYLPALYRDLFVAKVPTSHWSLQPAPSLLPDGVVIAGVRAVGGGATVALQVFATLALLNLLAATTALARFATGAPLRHVFPRAAFGVGAAAFWIGTSTPAATVLFSGFHGAAFGVGLWVYLWALTLAAPRVPLPGAAFGFWCRLAGITVATALTGASDGIYDCWVTLPLGLLLLVGPFVLRVPLGRAYSVVVALAVGAVAERGLAKVPAALGWDTPKAYAGVEFSWGRVVDFLGQFPSPLLSDAHRTVFLAVAAAAFVGLVLAALRPASGSLRARERVMASAGLLMVAACLAGAIATNIYRDLWGVRYLQPALFLPFLAVPFLRARPLAIGAVFAFALPVDPTISGTLEIRPKITGCVVGIAQREEISYGFATYWVAHRVTETAPRPLRVLAVEGNGAPRIWLNNPYWYPIAEAAPRFLVVLRDLNSAEIRARFGEPNAVVRCGEDDVWIFRR